MTQQLTQQFEQLGGSFLHPTDDELATLIALQSLQKKNDAKFDAWLRDRRPVSQLPCLQAVCTWLFDGVASSPAVVTPAPADEASSPAANAVAPPAAPTVSVAPLATPHSDDTADRLPAGTNASPPTSQPETRSPAPPPKTRSPAFQPDNRSRLGDRSIATQQLPIGKRLVAQQVKDVLSLRVPDLTKHTVILAGSGSGKTVLLRRLVEEAVLLGIPAITIDCANDLARLGDPWPAPPDAWDEGDRQKAVRYQAQKEVVVWTPGREAGNPLHLNPLPDLAAVANDPEDLSLAANMARDALQDIVAPGKSQTAEIKRGILKAALLYFAKNGGGGLPEFVELLSDLPPDASGGMSQAAKKAQTMADSLRAEILNNPLLRHEGTALDPAVLFGLDRPSEKTRISVLNFVGLPNLSAQQQFLNQLFMTLFTWIKQHPAPTDRPIRGLLVLDEAKDFVPSRKSTACKASLNRLVSQARKYGLGLIFATQEPKSIDHTIIANCSTQFYGRANSPASITVIQDQLQQRGGSGKDIARLESGQFYATSEGLAAPAKICTSLCLSHHPPTPLDEAEVLRRAVACRRLL